jgi:hypothetical protein
MRLDAALPMNPPHQARSRATLDRLRGLDHPLLNNATDRFVQEGLAKNVTLEAMNHPGGRHGFDIIDDDARSREIIARTLEFLKARLQ